MFHSLAPVLLYEFFSFDKDAKKVFLMNVSKSVTNSKSNQILCPVKDFNDLMLHFSQYTNYFFLSEREMKTY